jgi:hypothetical protein
MLSGGSSGRCGGLVEQIERVGRARSAMRKGAGLVVAGCLFVGTAAACSSSGTTVNAGGISSADTNAGAPVAGTVPTASSSPAPPTSALYGGWDTCRTRLALDQAVYDSDNLDPGARQSANAELHRLPVPPGQEAMWQTYLQVADRTLVLADQVHETDQTSFDIALNKLMGSDPEMLRLEKTIGAYSGTTMHDIETRTPCDPTGMPAGFGCTDPSACTAAWIDAEARDDQHAIDALGSVKLHASGAAGKQGTATGCSPDQATGATTCGVRESGTTPTSSPAGTGPVTTTVELEWARTTDGRWFGAGSKVKQFQAVGQAIN